MVEGVERVALMALAASGITGGVASVWYVNEPVGGCVCVVRNGEGPSLMSLIVPNAAQCTNFLPITASPSGRNERGVETYGQRTIQHR